MKKIPLTNDDRFCLVDDEDYSKLAKYKWCSSKGRDDPVGYALTTTPPTRSMHRMILKNEIEKSPRNLVTDHINKNTFDNRRKNLRLVTISENGLNR